MKKILCVFLLVFLSNSTLFAQEDDTKATKAKSDENYENSGDIIEQQKKVVEKAGKTKMVSEKPDEYFEKEFKNLPSEIQSLNIEDFLYSYGLDLLDGLPEMETFGMDIFSLGEDSKIGIELFDLIMTELEITSPKETQSK